MQEDLQDNNNFEKKARKRKQPPSKDKVVEQNIAALSESAGKKVELEPIGIVQATGRGALKQSPS
jgi:hypothetical protein